MNDFNYEPVDKIKNKCLFLKELKNIEFYENKRHKMVSILVKQYECCKKDKDIIISNDCVDCDSYINVSELLHQYGAYVKNKMRNNDDYNI